MKKLVAESLNEFYSKDEDKLADQKLQLYQKSKEYTKKNPEHTDNNVYRVINSIQKNGYYIVPVSPRWNSKDVNNLFKELNTIGIRSEKININNSSASYDLGIKIYNEEKNPEITDKILKILEKTDPAGDIIYSLM
jgi:hypothetical protein